MKRLISLLVLGTVWTVLLVLTTSCSTYTCPTYSGSTPSKPKYNEGKATMVKQSNIYYNRRY